MTPGLAFYGAFCVVVGFGLGLLARHIIGPSIKPLSVEDLHAPLPAEPLRPDLYDTVFDELCGYRRTGP